MIDISFGDIEESLKEVDGGEWETLIDFTKIRKDGVPVEEVLERLKEKKDL